MGSDPDQSLGHQAEGVNGHDLDEKVSIPLPFEDALRALLATEAPGNGKPDTRAAEKGSDPPRRERSTG